MTGWLAGSMYVLYVLCGAASTSIDSEALEMTHHVIGGGNELNGGVENLRPLVRLTIRAGDWVVHELIRNWKK